MDDNLRRKLQRLGVVKGLRNLKPPPHPAPPPARNAPLPGEEIATPHGPTWVAQRWYPARQRHGAYPLAEITKIPPETLQLLGMTGSGSRTAFLDTETTGLAGGTGTLIFLTGVGVWEDTGLRLHQVFLRHPGEERAAIHYLELLLGTVTALVTFNGRGFDLPLLETRFILQRRPPTWRALPHLDLLTVARLLWREHLPSRRLGVLETEILDITRTAADLPGWLIPAAYRDYLNTGDTREMCRIFYHNEIDILSLVTLLTHTARLAEEPDALSPAATEWVGVGRLYDRAGHAAQAAAAWRRALEADTLPPDVAARLWRELSRRHKRAQEWPEARALWENWAARLPWAIEPLVEQAKYHEWVTRDLVAALAETDTALRRAEALPRGLRRQQRLAELRHRRERLQRKIKRRP